MFIERESDRLKELTVTEVAVLVGCSVQTINYWYAFKRENKDSEDETIRELVSCIPDYKQSGSRQTRYWEEADVFQLVRFKNMIPKGRNGFLGSVTQKYCKKK